MSQNTKHKYTYDRIKTKHCALSILLYAKIPQKIVLHSRSICENKCKDEICPCVSAHRIEKGINVILFHILYERHLIVSLRINGKFFLCRIETSKKLANSRIRMRGNVCGQCDESRCIYIYREENQAADIRFECTSMYIITMMLNRCFSNSFILTFGIVTWKKQLYFSIFKSSISFLPHRSLDVF